MVNEKSIQTCKVLNAGFEYDLDEQISHIFSELKKDNLDIEQLPSIIKVICKTYHESRGCHG